MEIHDDFNAATSTIKLSGAGSGEFAFDPSFHRIARLARPLRCVITLLRIPGKDTWHRLGGKHEERPTHSGKGLDSRAIGRPSPCAKTFRVQCLEGAENLG